MFTGIIEETAKVVSLKKKGSTAVLTAFSSLRNVKLGSSISVNGTCLTVVSMDKGALSFDLSGETLSSTTLSALKAGDMVNLEPALSADGRLGGHFVTGHVDGVGYIRKKIKEANTIKIEISVPQNLMDMFVPKGSVAVDGISLTVVDVLKDGFTVVIIPHTVDMTTIGSKEVGSGVNIETDLIGKYVIKYLKAHGAQGSNLMRALMEKGFVK